MKYLDEIHHILNMITESREELSKQFTTRYKIPETDREYIDICPFCCKRNSEHTQKEAMICVYKRYIAQGII